MIRSCFVNFVHRCCSFDEFVEDKVISPSYSSAILTRPLSVNFTCQQPHPYFHEGLLIVYLKFKSNSVLCFNSVKTGNYKVTVKSWTKLLLSRALGLTQPIEIDQRPDKKFRQGFIMTPPAAGREREQTTDPLACFLACSEGAGSSELVPYTK